MPSHETILASVWNNGRNCSLVGWSLHHRHGVATRFGVGVEDISGTAGRLRAQLNDGSRLHATTVVVAIGTLPNDGWLADLGLRPHPGASPSTTERPRRRCLGRE